VDNRQGKWGNFIIYSARNRENLIDVSCWALFYAGFFISIALIAVERSSLLTMSLLN